MYRYRKSLKSDWILSEISEKLYQEEDAEQNPQAITTLFVMAPVLCRYILWVLEEAMRIGEKRLYFLARDGYSMYQVAKIICREAGLPIECRYLYCSRYAWRSAEYSLLGRESLSYICLGGIDVTFEKVMHRAGLSKVEAYEVSEALGYSDKLQKPMSYNEVKELEPVLASCKIFMEKMLNHSKKRYPEVCGYLRQEGLLENIPYALVDSGWTGSMQKCLQHLLDSMGYQEKIEGYYFGMYEYPQNVDVKTYHPYYFGPTEEIRRKVYFSNSLFECIFSSPEGMTLGYELKEDRYEPRLEHKHNPNREKIEKSTEYLKEYAFLLSTEFKDEILSSNIDFKKTAENLLYYFMGKPTVSEAKEYGNYIFCDDVVGEESQKVAASLTYEQAKENYLLYKSMNKFFKQGKPVCESAWIEGTAVLTDKVGKGSYGIMPYTNTFCICEKE